MFVSLNDNDKQARAVNIVRAFVRLGFKVIATEGTSAFLTAQGIRNRTVLKASEGTLNIPKPFKPEVNEKVYLIRGEKIETIKVKGQELYLGEVEDMADAILLGNEPRVTLDDSRANVAVISALLASARTGMPVRL